MNFENVTLEGRKYFLDHIEHNANNIRHLLIDDYFLTSDFFTIEDIRFLVNTQITLILSHIEELREFEV